MKLKLFFFMLLDPRQCLKKVINIHFLLIYPNNFLGNQPNTSTQQQRASLGRFAALINDSIENTDQDDFVPTTQKRFSEGNTKTTKRKLTNSFTGPTTIEKKRTKKTNLFQEVVSVTSLSLRENKSSLPPPPWLDLPIGTFSNNRTLKTSFYTI
jgi:hypothetical protein